MARRFRVSDFKQARRRLYFHVAVHYQSLLQYPSGLFGVAPLETHRNGLVNCFPCISRIGWFYTLTGLTLFATLVLLLVLISLSITYLQSLPLLLQAHL